MKIFNIQTRLSIMIKSALALVLVATVSSCDPTLDSLSYDLPDANSKADLTPPTASFSAAESQDFLTWTFGNTSSSATDYAWDYGDGNSSTGVDGINTFPDEGTYTVTLTASDKLGVTSTFSMQIEVVEPPIPAAIIPEVLNGDMEAGSENWRMDFSNGWDNYGFESSGDGSTFDYDNDTGAKTKGAKWNLKRSAGEYANPNTRHAIQGLTVSPGRDYILEFEYAIKDDEAADPVGGRRIVGEILPGHFTDGADAFAVSDAGNALVSHIGDVVEGKGNFKLVKVPFTADDSGLITIFIYGVTPVDAYVDNVKVYPVD